MGACIYGVNTGDHCSGCEKDLYATIERIQKNYDDYIADSVRVTQRIAEERDAALAVVRRLEATVERLEASQRLADENAAPDERAASALEEIEKTLRTALNEGWG